MKKFARIAAVVVLVTILLAWVVGGLRQEADLIPFIKKAIPGAVYFESISGGIYAGKTSIQPGTPVLGYAAIVLALIFRNPARFNYEVFGTFFNLAGTYFQYALLAVVLVTSLFIIRSWCNYICPLRAVADYVRMMRHWMKNEPTNSDFSEFLRIIDNREFPVTNSASSDTQSFRL
jgi:hypothetical protein